MYHVKSQLSRVTLTLIFTLTIIVFSDSSIAQSFKKAAPYSKIEWNSNISEYPQVLLNNTWYLLLGINDIPAMEIITFCHGNYGARAIKRFNEDLVEVLSSMGHPPGNEVKLFLSDLKTKEKITLENVEMTLENRQSILQASTKKEKDIEDNAPEQLTFEQIKEDLEFFQKRIELQFAYLKANNFDYKSTINHIKEKSTNGLSRNKFAWELQKIMAHFIDGHSGISPRKYENGYLPFSTKSIGGRIVAFKHDRSSFVVEGFPYLTKLDNIDIQNWINYADDFRAIGSIQYRTYQALRLLRYYNHVRKTYGFTVDDSVEVELLSSDLTKTKKIVFPILAEKPEKEKQVFRDSKILDGNIGYLRLASFLSDGGAVPEVDEWMPKFENTKGLIVDVRNNGGGSRAALISLSKYLMDTNDTPSIGNVCAFRLYEEFQPDHLAARYAYKADDKRWNEKERKAINNFSQTFIPQWQPNHEEFSDWHYVVLSKDEKDKQYYYNKPVIILLNGGCFSATDIFLGALKGWKDNIKLVGTPSGGGSARSMRFMLPNSKLKVRNASMVSYQRTGALYDSNGIQPDFLVYPEPEYFLNGKDNVLEKALQIIKISEIKIH